LYEICGPFSKFHYVI